MATPTINNIGRITALAGIATFTFANASPAHAAGYALREGSADWMATSFAGDTAKAYDASTVWMNPAGMVRLNQNEIDASVNAIFPGIDFTGANYTGATTTTSGTASGNLIQAAATAGFYGVWSLSPDFKLGFGADAPFGQRVTNPTDFVGRYQSLVSSITDEAFTISAAYKINEQWSIGGGPVVDVFTARLTQALNLGPYAALGDPVADLHGSDVSAGFNIGVLYQATPDLRFGLDYRSRIQHNISGTQSVAFPAAISTYAPPIASYLASQSSAAKTAVTLPDSATLGLYWQATPQLALLGELGWTDWSLLKSIAVTPDSAAAAPSTIPENWRNTVAVSVGANYRLNPALMLQGGIGFDQSPVTNSNRTSRIPDSNRYLIGLGAQYDIMPNLTLQVAYVHVFFDQAPVDTQASSTSGILSGKYANVADTASLGMKYRF